MKIDTCIIVKNEEKTIRKLIEQFLIFSNEIHITDTGSTDNTINIINEFVNKCSNIYLHNYQWCMDFAKARNYSLTCYDRKSDYQFWCDGDDELNDKLIETLKEFAASDNKNADIYFVKYKYFSADTNPHNRTSLLKVSADLRWHDPIHEYVAYTVNHKVDYDLFNNGSLIIHKRPDNVSHTDRNLKIFMNMEKNNYNFSCRNRYYYARELMYNKLNEYAIHQYHKCIDSKDDNRLDKYNASNRLFEMNDSEAIDYFFKLFKKGVYRKDMFYKAGKYFFDKSQYDLSKFYYLMCVHCDEPKPGLSFGYNPICHINSLLQLNLVEYKLGNIKKAIEYNNKVLELEPSNKAALENLAFYKRNEDRSNK